jgi:dolichol-phosphate mannosyltransferase
MNDISVVIPVRNEEKNLKELAGRLASTFEGMQRSFEVIFVTDLNTDHTVEVLKALHAADPRVKMLKLTNAFGHHVAVYAGLQHVSGDVIVIMDGDLQDHPEDIPKLYAKMQEGYDIVYGRKQRKNESALRNICSRSFVAVLRWLSDYRMDFNTCMFRMVSRRVVDAVLQFKEREPSLTFIMGVIGFPTASVEVTSGVREHGRTNYGFLRQINLAISSVVSFSTKPLRLISLLGLTMSLLSLVYFLLVLVQWIMLGIPVAGWATIIAMLSLIGGILLFAQGITGEYVARIFMETKRRPLFVVEEAIDTILSTNHAAND